MSLEIMPNNDENIQDSDLCAGPEDISSDAVCQGSRIAECKHEEVVRRRGLFKVKTSFAAASRRIQGLFRRRGRRTDASCGDARSRTRWR
jgi:hypothetical protein